MLSLTFCIALLASFRAAAAAGPPSVQLGSAGDFAIIGKSGVSTVPNSVIGGDVGVSPVDSTALTGFSLVLDSTGQFWTSTQVDGKLFSASDAAPTPGKMTVAVSDMEAAYTDAAGRPNPEFINLNSGLIGGSVLIPGLYKWTTAVSISTDITLIGSPTDTWIFQIDSTLSLGANVVIHLEGGAVADNIVWVVADVVSVGAGATFEGTILAKTNVVLQTSAIDHGCIYAQTQVSLDMATVECNSPVLPSPTDTVTSVPPTETSIPPTIPPTDTSIPPTLPPTETSVPPTETSVPPTETSVPPTDTSVPPTPTETSVPPTGTPIPPTHSYPGSSTSKTTSKYTYSSTSTVKSSTTKKPYPVPSTTKKTTTAYSSTKKTTTPYPTSTKKTTTPYPTSTKKTTTPYPATSTKKTTSTPYSSTKKQSSTYGYPIPTRYRREAN